MDFMIFPAKLVDERELLRDGKLAFAARVSNCFQPRCLTFSNSHHTILSAGGVRHQHNVH